MVDSAYSKAGTVQTEFDSVVNLAGQVKDQELQVKNAMDEQNQGNSLVLSCITQMKEGTQAVEQAAKNLTTPKLLWDESQRSGSSSLFCFFPRVYEFNHKLLNI